MTECYHDLLKQIDTELSEFYSVYTAVVWKPERGQYYTTKDGDHYADIDFYKEFGQIKTGFTIQIKLTINQFLYKTTVFYTNLSMIDHVIYNKDLHYNEFITDQDKENIINKIGNLINQFIETQGFTLHGPRL